MIYTTNVGILRNPAIVLAKQIVMKVTRKNPRISIIV